MTKEAALKIIEKILYDNFEIYYYSEKALNEINKDDKKALNKINEECGNYKLENLSNNEIYTWLHGIWDGLTRFHEEAKLKRRSKNDDR